eukprot:gene258-879_t
MASVFPLSTPVPSKVSFGTTLDRDLLPLKPPHTRAGNELGLRGEPNLAPGAYDNHQVSSFVYELDRRPVCKKGYSLGSRTAPKFPKESNASFPGPPAYQPIISKHREFSPAYKPFQNGATRLPPVKQHATPGPGSYEQHAAAKRQMQFHGSFGGPQTLRNSIAMICHNGDPDTCLSCDKVPSGDYYKNRSTALCRGCYEEKTRISQSKESKKQLKLYEKVRDCRSIHVHEGTNAKMRLMSEKDLKKLRTREAYMSLYY